MQFRHQLAFAILLFLPPCACAQVGTAGMDPAQFGNVHVHVVYPSDRSAGLHLRVRLLSGGGMPMGESLTNDQGIAEFTGVPIGDYHIVVSGEGIQEADSGEFELDRRKTSQDLYITVRSTASDANQPVGGAPTVAAVDLNVPPEAQKEFDLASKQMADQDWAKAVDRLKNAISIYPRYASAYNNLGVAYGRLNQPDEERAALKKAVELDDHLVQAFVNLAKMSLREHDSAQAESLLEKAARADFANAETLTLLAEAQLLNKHYDAAIATARSVHSMPHQNFAVVHYIAARSFEHEHRQQDALSELQLCLTEEPQGARADHVREEIARLKSRQP